MSSSDGGHGLQNRLLRLLAVATTVGMFLVLLTGTLVTNTGSAEGCGGSWPLCQGKFIPELAVSTTLIEFRHRGATAIVSTLIMALAIWSFVVARDRLEIRILAPLQVIFLVLQAVLGGLATKYPESAPILALHFGISLVAFASAMLTMFFIWEAGGRDALRDIVPPRLFRWTVWGSLIFTYVIVYLGAYTRHSNASLACPDWPLCNGGLVPGVAGTPISAAIGADFAHRVSALIGALLIAWLWVQAARIRRERPDLFVAACFALVLIILQALSGSFIVSSLLSLSSTLLHGGLVTLLFGAQTYLALHIFPRPLPSRATRAVPATIRSGESMAGSQ